MSSPKKKEGPSTNLLGSSPKGGGNYNTLNTPVGSPPGPSSDTQPLLAEKKKQKEKEKENKAKEKDKEKKKKKKKKKKRGGPDVMNKVKKVRTAQKLTPGMSWSTRIKLYLKWRKIQKACCGCCSE
jgi:hypothetical protein